MGTEIEVKYLLRENGTHFWNPHVLQICSSFDSLVDRVLAEGDIYRQGYLPIDTGYEVLRELSSSIHFIPIEARLRRISRQSTHRFIFTVKGDGTLERNEENTVISQSLYDRF